MSRNLLMTTCYYCDSEVTTEEAPRLYSAETLRLVILDIQRITKETSHADFPSR